MGGTEPEPNTLTKRCQSLDRLCAAVRLWDQALEFAINRPLGKMTPTVVHDGHSTQRQPKLVPKHHLLSSARHIDELLREIEDIVLGADAGSAFPKYWRDLTAAQSKNTRDYIAQIRGQLLRALHSQGIDPPEPQFGSLHSIRVTLQFALIDVEECRPEKMRGYGGVPEAAVPELEGLLEEVRSSLDKLDVFLRGGDTEDLKTRVEKQVRNHPELGVLARMERIIDRYGLVEFRSASILHTG